MGALSSGPESGTEGAPLSGLGLEESESLEETESSGADELPEEEVLPEEVPSEEPELSEEEVLPEEVLPEEAEPWVEVELWVEDDP